MPCSVPRCSSAFLNLLESRRVCVSTRFYACPVLLWGFFSLKCPLWHATNVHQSIPDADIKMEKRDPGRAFFCLCVNLCYSLSCQLRQRRMEKHPAQNRNAVQQGATFPASTVWFEHQGKQLRLCWGRSLTTVWAFKYIINIHIKSVEDLLKEKKKKKKKNKVYQRNV